MNSVRSLTLTVGQHNNAKRHLFPGDGLEAAVVLVCRRVGMESERLIVRKVIAVPYEDCSVRTEDRLTWPGSAIEDAMDIAEDHGDCVILLHSHPGGFFGFSEIDDLSDNTTMPCLYSAIPGPSAIHGSAIMTPNGAVLARVYPGVGQECVFLRTMVVGHDIKHYGRDIPSRILHGTEGMRDLFGYLTVCVVGASGTGSIIIEQLARNGIGHIILIDFDKAEWKNLNRILNCKVRHVETDAYKTELLAESISEYAPSIRITCINRSIFDPAAIEAASSADTVFSCVDRQLGRSVCERISTAFIAPLVDLGVTIPTRTLPDGTVVVSDMCGRIDFVRPDGPNLSDRGVITPKGLYDEHIFLNAPDEAIEQVRNGYISGVAEEAPSVINVNMVAAARAYTEWTIRQLGGNLDPNESVATIRFSLCARDEDHVAEADYDHQTLLELGQGFASPLLGFPALVSRKIGEAA
tara:strand:- start:23820 stop:25217 length:1398 start_codon:yes stop_codon:yes gene_type:complete